MERLSLLSKKIVRPAGLVVGAGTALSSFGLAVPAQAAVDCSTGVTVAASEQAIRDAIADGETLICVNPGTIDLSSSGPDAAADPIEVFGADLTLVALGEVILDGGDETTNAIVSVGSSDENLTVDGFTIQNFFNDNDNPYGVVGLWGSSGAITVLNSYFTSNSGYATVTAEGDGEFSGEVVVDNTSISDSTMLIAQVWGKGDITVTRSRFLENDGNAVNSENEYDDAVVTIHSNIISETQNGPTVLYIDAESSLIYNNTFTDNVDTTGGNGPTVIWLQEAQDSVIAFNTFVNNTATGGGPNIRIETETEARLLGNIWINDGDFALQSHDETDVTAVFIDEGGNFANTDESQYIGHLTSDNEVPDAEFDISAPADNGGVTETAAIGADSVAIDAVLVDVANDVLGIEFTRDQRGYNRVGARDAGAYEYGATPDEELAATGADASIIALTGGVLGVAGVALVARRRRQA